MVTIRDTQGDFEYVITFTNPSDSSTKDTESDEIYLKGGNITYKDNDMPNSAVLILDRTTDSSWIGELFEVEIKTRGVGESTWLYRFIGRVGEPTFTPATVTLPCVGDADRLSNRFATERFFFDELVDSKTYEIKTGTPKYVDLDAGKRPIRPLIDVRYFEALKYTMTTNYAWIHLALELTYGDNAGMTFYVTKLQHLDKIRLMLAKDGAVNNFAYRIYICGITQDGAGKDIPDITNVLASTSLISPIGLVDFRAGPPFDGPVELTLFPSSLELEPYKKYGIQIEVSNWVSGGLHVRVDSGTPDNTFGRGHYSIRNWSTSVWTAYPDRAMWFWIWGLSDDFWIPLREGYDFNVDYVNKKINFDYPDAFDPFVWTDMLKVTYFKGYPTIDDVITALHDDYLSDFTDGATITPTDKLDLRPFRVEESTILSLIQELLKLGPWSFRIYKDTSGNIQFEFVDSYVVSDWGSAPFTGAFANLRKFYFGGDATGGEEGYIKIVDDKRVILGAEFVNSMSLKNPDADLAIAVNNPPSITYHGRLSKSTFIVRSADNLDELVAFAEYLFQGYGTQIVEGDVLLDRVSFKTADALFTHCNDLIYIKDTRVGYNGAFKLTRIRLSLTAWTFEAYVTNKRPTVTVDKLLSGHSLQFRPSVDYGMLEQKSFASPRAELLRGDWTQVRRVLGVDDTGQVYNAGYTYKIGIGDSDAAGTVMGNEVARVTCETNEITGKIHTLDIDGDSSDEYRLATAIFDKDDFGTSFPYTIKEVGLYDNVTLKKRLVLKTPWPGAPASEDYFHPFVIVHRDGKLFVCWIITA